MSLLFILIEFLLVMNFELKKIIFETIINLDNFDFIRKHMYISLMNFVGKIVETDFCCFSRFLTRLKFFLVLCNHTKFYFQKNFYLCCPLHLIYTVITIKASATLGACLIASRLLTSDEETLAVSCMYINATTTL